MQVNITQYKPCNIDTLIDTKSGPFCTGIPDTSHMGMFTFCVIITTNQRVWKKNNSSRCFEMCHCFGFDSSWLGPAVVLTIAHALRIHAQGFRREEGAWCRIQSLIFKKGLWSSQLWVSPFIWRVRACFWEREGGRGLGRGMAEVGKLNWVELPGNPVPRLGRFPFWIIILPALCPRLTAPYSPDCRPPLFSSTS